MLDRRIMWLAGSLLGVAGTASAQVAPRPGAAAPATPAPGPAPAAPAAPAPAPAVAGPAPAAVAPVPAAPPTPTTPAPARIVRPALDPALVERAREARQTGKLIDVTSPAAVDGCRDLGSDVEGSDADGLTGRARIRIALRRIARPRGASHMFYFEHRDGAVQTEHGRFFDCTGDDMGAGPPSLTPSATAPPADGAMTASAHAPVYSGAASVQIDILPAGSITEGASDFAQTRDSSTTVGVSAAIEYFLSPQVAIGLAPGLVFGVKPDDSEPTSATQLDVRARLRFGQLQRDGLALSGYVTLGGSLLFLPRSDGESSSGASAGVGLGVSYPLRNGSFVMFELGYQFGDQSIGGVLTDSEFSTEQLHIGLGVGSYL